MTLESACKEIIKARGSYEYEEASGGYADNHYEEYCFLASKSADKLARACLVMKKALEALMTDQRNCACEPGDDFEPEFICGGHGTIEQVEKLFGEG